MKTLNYDELDTVIGGARIVSSVKTQKRMIECPDCQTIFEADIMKSFAKCPKCPKVIEFKG